MQSTVELGEQSLTAPAFELVASCGVLSRADRFGGSLLAVEQTALVEAYRVVGREVRLDGAYHQLEVGLLGCQLGLY